MSSFKVYSMFRFILIEYHFVPRADMEKMIARGEFLETTEFSSNLYGTRLFFFKKKRKLYSSK